MAASMNSLHAIFHRSVGSIFDGWTALQLAVNHGYGGAHSREKAVWLVEVVSNWFQENDDIEPDELENFIASIMDNEFDTRAEDGSLIEICRTICDNFSLCQKGKHAEVLQRIQKMPQASLGACQSADGPEEEDEEDEEMSPCAHNVQAMMGEMSVGTGGSREPVQNGFPESEQDSASSTETKPPHDDGWTVVRKSKKK